MITNMNPKKLLCYFLVNQNDTDQRILKKPLKSLLDQTWLRVFVNHQKIVIPLGILLTNSSQQKPSDSLFIPNNRNQSTNSLFLHYIS